MANFTITAALADITGPPHIKALGFNVAAGGTQTFGTVNSSDVVDIAPFMVVKGIYQRMSDTVAAVYDTFCVAVSGIANSPTQYPEGTIIRSLDITPPSGEPFTLYAGDATVSIVSNGNLGSSSALDTVVIWEWTTANNIQLRSAFAAASQTAITLNAGLTATQSTNCDCVDETDNETLGALRRRMLVRLGYAAQADNPPPGMADLLDDFLVQAQRLLYRRYNALRTERFFSWNMVPGKRYYDLKENDDTCSLKLDPYTISWCGFADLNGVWLELIGGIPPEFYTSVNFLGYPSRYEVRQCIEVFPAPAEAYTLRVKGKFGLTALTADDDKTTIDSELVFMWALGNAKSHYGQPDANNVIAQATTYLKDLTAGGHLTKRYVPGTSPTQPWTQPKFLPIGNS